MGLSILDVTEHELPAIADVLHRHVETSMFLLSNLKDHGFRLAEAMNSGNLRHLRDDAAINGVFCLTRRGNILAETGGSPEFATAIAKPIPRQSASHTFLQIARCYVVTPQSPGLPESLL